MAVNGNGVFKIWWRLPNMQMQRKISDLEVDNFILFFGLISLN